MGLGKQIRKYREKAGWTLEQLSTHAEVEVGTISALEQRDSKRSQYMGKIATAFGLTIEQLCDEKQNYPLFALLKARGPVAVNEAAPPSQWPFSLSYDRYKDLPDREKGRIDGYMLALAEAYESAAKKTAANGAG